MTKVRKCGGCTACCYGAEVSSGIKILDEVDRVVEKIAWVKPRRTSCGYLCKDGCSLQKVKPKACVDFECQWLSGEFPESMRPDKCGVIFWIEPSEVLGQMLVAEEAWPGASETAEFKELCDMVSQWHELFVYNKGPSRTLVAKGKRTKLVDLSHNPDLDGATRVPYERIHEEIEEAKEKGATFV